MHLQGGIHTKMKFLENIELADGETLTMNCPVCKGIKKFTITKVDRVLLYNCYRNSCTVKGAKKVDRTADDIKRKMNGHSIKSEPLEFKIPEYFSRDLDECDDFIMKWNLSSVDLYHDVKNNRVVFPIKKKGRVVDAIGRALDKNVVPKWYKYGSHASHYSHTVQRLPVSTAVLVEDVLSAITVATYFPVTGFGILGTALLQEHIYLLSNFDRVVVALDPDALQKTLQHSKELTNYVKSVRVLRLTDDLKYKNLEDFNKLREMLNE